MKDKNAEKEVGGVRGAERERKIGGSNLGEGTR